jgi:hypothetical protein
MSGEEKDKPAEPAKEVLAEYHAEADNRRKRQLFGIGADRIIELSLIFVLAGTAITQCRVSNKQWNAMLESNKISNTSFVSTQRAYMYFADINTRKTGDGSALIFYVAPKFGNSGNTPTSNLKARANCWSDEKVEQEPFDKFRADKNPWIEGFYGPKAILQATECSVPLDQAKQIAAGRLHFYFAGEAEYEDGVSDAPVKRITQFSQEFMISAVDERGGGLTGAISQRGRHNCADRCPP